MRQPNWSGYASESAADFAAEDRIGAYTVEPPTPEEDQALSLELARENAEGAEEEGGMDEQLLREDAYQSSRMEWEDEAHRETYASLHPRPEEVG